MSSPNQSTGANGVKKGMFHLPDGTNMIFTFALISSLFFLWGFCNCMIDTMDKHFQDQLGLTKAQSAWVQFAHYMGYSLMALPAGLLTRRLGYKGGIIFGLMLVAVGGFWFMPATSISQFWAFLLGVCVIAMGLTVLETVANPYTTLLGPKEYGATRINLAQSCNGIGWIVGPLVGASYFYSEAGVEKASGQIYIPYLGVGIIVLILAVLFMRAKVPDIKVPDEYHTDDNVPINVEKNNGMVFLMMLLNVAALALSVYLILHTILPAATKATEGDVEKYWWAFGALVVCAVPLLVMATKRITTHSIWSHPHFSGATVAQFLYVAAQAGIFSFFINSMTVDKHNGTSIVPALPASLAGGTLDRWHWIETRTSISSSDIANLPALAESLKQQSSPVSAFIYSQISSNTLDKLTNFPAKTSAAALQKALVSDLNSVMRQELSTRIDAVDVKAEAFAARLAKNADAISAYLNQKYFTEKLKQALQSYQQSPTDQTKDALAAALAKSLNNMMADEHLYDAKRFEGVVLRDETRQLFQSGQYTNGWGRFNRLLLEDAYSAELARLKIFGDATRFAGVTLKPETKALQEEIPAKENARLRYNRMLLADAFPGVIQYQDGILCLSDKGAGKFSSIAFGFFLLGRLVGAFLMKKSPAHKILGLFALLNVGICALIIGQLGWISVACVFLSYFFMSVMFPTIFALGIFGLGSQSKKKAAAFIVMSITGGALMPKFMGHLGDVYNMSVSFWMPLACFVLILLYGFFWPKLSRSEGMVEVKTGGH